MGIDRKPSVAFMFMARTLLGEALKETLPATAEAFLPCSDIELEEEEEALAIRFAIFLEDRVKWLA